MSALQVAIEAVNATVPLGSDYSRELIAAKCRALLAGYHARWQNAGYVTLAAEEMVESDLWNPETGRKSRPFRIAGKIDVKAREGNRLILFDHKTTSEDISDPAGPYWRQLAIEAQPSHYMLLAWLNGEKFDGAVWDVVKKPGISPKKVSKAEAQMVVMSKRYGRRDMSEASVEAMTQPEPRETLEMYEARLADDCTQERPQHYFQRKPVPRLDAEIREWAIELWIHGQEVLHARNTERHPRNSAACMAYGRPCVYLGICSGYDTVDSDKWRRKQQVHPELPLLEGDGRDVLTNSRIKVFQLCRRKHELQYEIGLERQDEEEAESIFFGNVWHSGLEAWWNFYKEELRDKGEVNGNNHAAGFPESDFGTTAINETPVTI
jgi:hypothetical protein